MLIAAVVILFTGRKRSRCEECEGCLVEEDCGDCVFCADNPKFGPGRKKQCCTKRKCKSQLYMHQHHQEIILSYYVQAHYCPQQSLATPTVTKCLLATSHRFDI